jgi:hypothetical protein
MQNNYIAILHVGMAFAWQSSNNLTLHDPRNILDNKAPGTRFGQCLQGFRVIKKVPTMGCTISAFYAKILQ